MAREDPVPEAMTKILSKLSKNVSSSWLKLLEHGDEIDCDIWIILNKRCKWKVKLDKSWISCKLIIHVYIHTYIFMYIYICICIHILNDYDFPDAHWNLG